MSLLLRNHADVDAKDYDSRTAIHLAASEGNLRIVEFLLDAGANPNSKDRWGGTALRDAVREGHTQVATLLSKRGGELGLDEVAASGELCEIARAGRLDNVR